MYQNDYTHQIRKHSPLLQGILPGTNQVLLFREEQVLGDGNCGFTTLGTSRNQVIQALLPLNTNKEARESLKEEIQEAFISGTLAATDTWINLSTSRNLQQQYQDQALRRIRATHSTLPEFEHLHDTLLWLEEQGQQQDLDSLRSAAAATHETEQMISRYCTSAAVYKAYIYSLGQNSWLGYKSALLYAKVKQLSLYIWVKSEINPGYVEIKDFYSANSNSPCIHMLHTANFTHFNLLTITTSPEQELDAWSNTSQYCNHITELDQELLACVFSFLPTGERFLELRRVCKKFAQALLLCLQLNITVRESLAFFLARTTLSRVEQLNPDIYRAGFKEFGLSLQRQAYKKLRAQENHTQQISLSPEEVQMKICATLSLQVSDKLLKLIYALPTKTAADSEPKLANIIKDLSTVDDKLMHADRVQKNLLIMLMLAFILSLVAKRMVPNDLYNKMVAITIVSCISLPLVFNLWYKYIGNHQGQLYRTQVLEEAEQTVVTFINNPLRERDLEGGIVSPTAPPSTITPIHTTLAQPATHEVIDLCQ